MFPDSWIVTPPVPLHRTIALSVEDTGPDTVPGVGGVCHVGCPATIVNTEPLTPGETCTAVSLGPPTHTA